MNLLTHFLTADQRCRVTIASAGAKDISTWYELWAQVVALDGMCGRAGRNGIAYDLGESNCHCYL